MHVERRCGLVSVVVALLFAWLATPFAAAAAPTRRNVPAAEVLRELRAGHSVVLENEVIAGPLVFRNGETVTSIFKCRLCTFRGRIGAADVSFRRALDLSGSRFLRRVDFRGATFAAPSLFRGATEEDVDEPPAPTRFEDVADFSLSVFDDLASFAGAEFAADAVFRDARFADVSFAASTFASSAAFDRAAFRGAATFNGAAFGESAVFEEATFQQRSDFSLARFESGAAFTAAQFGTGASFLAADFVSRSADEEAAVFDGIAAARNVDFTYATFTSRAKPPQVIAILDDVVIGGSLLLRDARFASHDLLQMKRVKVQDLIMEVELARQIENESDKRSVLTAIEDSAKTRRELGLANDAHYELLSLRSEDFGLVRRVFDRVVYRDAWGYLVQPKRPLAILIGIVAVASVIRFGRRWPAARNPSSAPPWRRLPRAAGRQVADLATSLLDTFERVSPRWSTQDRLRLPERFELIAYRVLLVAALIGLANSNPTLREMVDALV